MNLVKTYIDKSPIQGIGLFAGEDITKGTLIWELGGLDQVFSTIELNRINLTTSQVKYILRYIYNPHDSDIWIYCGDDAKFTNHSLDPNTQVFIKEQYTLRDIKKGEEITCNYYELDPDFTEEEFNDN